MFLKSKIIWTNFETGIFPRLSATYLDRMWCMMLVSKWFYCPAKYEKLLFNKNLCFPPFKCVFSMIVAHSKRLNHNWLCDGEVMFTQWKRPACKSQAEKMSQMGKRFMNYDDLKQFSIGDHIPVFSFHHAQCKYAWDDHQHIFVIASIASEKGKIRFINSHTICMHACVYCSLCSYPC